MAKVKKFSLRAALWTVKITVTDNDCLFSVNGNIEFDKLIKANNENAAVKGAASYCNRKMREYPGTRFSYSTKDVQPYFYPVRVTSNDYDNAIKTTKI
jgi:hypothetical protein